MVTHPTSFTCIPPCFLQPNRDSKKKELEKTIWRMNSQQKRRWEMMLSHTCTFTLITCSDKADIYRLLGTNKSLGNWQKSGTKEIFLLVTNIAAKHRDEKTPNGLLFLFIDWTKCPTLSNLPLPFSVCLFSSLCSRVVQLERGRGGMQKTRSGGK